MAKINKTINIAGSSDDWRGVALSNFALSPFVFEGRLLASVEGFIQGIKYPESDPVRDAAFTAYGRTAKSMGENALRNAVYWGGAVVEYGSPLHHNLIGRAIRQRIVQSPGLRQVLSSTGDMVIVHETGEPEPLHTSLPATVFCRILTAVRDEIV